MDEALALLWAAVTAVTKESRRRAAEETERSKTLEQASVSSEVEPPEETSRRNLVTETTMVTEDVRDTVVMACGSPGDSSQTVSVSIVNPNVAANRQTQEIDRDVSETHGEINRDASETHVEINRDASETHEEINRDASESHVEINQDAWETRVEINRDAPKTHVEINQDASETRVEINRDAPKTHVEINRDAAPLIKMQNELNIIKSKRAKKKIKLNQNRPTMSQIKQASQAIASFRDTERNALSQLNQQIMMSLLQQTQDRALSATIVTPAEPSQSKNTTFLPEESSMDVLSQINDQIIMSLAQNQTTVTKSQPPKQSQVTVTKSTCITSKSKGVNTPQCLAALNLAMKATFGENQEVTMTLLKPVTRSRKRLRPPIDLALLPPPSPLLTIPNKPDLSKEPQDLALPSTSTSKKNTTKTYAEKGQQTHRVNPSEYKLQLAPSTSQSRQTQTVILTPPAQQPGDKLSDKTLSFLKSTIDNMDFNTAKHFLRAVCLTAGPKWSKFNRSITQVEQTSSESETVQDAEKPLEDSSEATQEEPRDFSAQASETASEVLETISGNVDDPTNQKSLQDPLPSNVHSPKEPMAK